MPPIAKHSARKLIFYRALAALERPLRHRPALERGNLRAIRNFLFLQYDVPLGSAVHATPLFEAIKRAMPDAHLSVAASEMVASVLAHNPFVDRCVVTPDPWKDFFGAVRMVRELYRTLPAGPDCVATTLGNQRSRLAFLAMHAAPDAIRTGYMLATPMYDLPLVIDAERSQLDHNLEILRVLGHEAATLEPRVYFCSHDTEFAADLLQADSYDQQRIRIAFVTQNSGTQPNKWRGERFQQVISTLSTDLKALPVFVGSAQEAKNISQLRDRLPEKGIMLAGKTTIPQLAAVLAQCDAVVSLDTGTFHVARAVQLPGVVIAPGWQNPVEWLPLRHPKYKVLWSGPIAEATAGHFIDEISAEQVIAATKELLARYSANGEARQSRVQAALCDNKPTGHC